MDPPKSPSSMAHEPGGTRPTVAAVADDDASSSLPTFGAPIKLSPSSSDEDVSSSTVSGGLERDSLANNAIRSPPILDVSAGVAHDQAVSPQHVVVSASDVRSPSDREIGSRRASRADGVDRHSSLLDACVDGTHTRVVTTPATTQIPTSSVTSTADVVGLRFPSLANIDMQSFPLLDASIKLVRNQAEPSDSNTVPDLGDLPCASLTGDTALPSSAVDTRALLELTPDIAGYRSTAVGGREETHRVSVEVVDNGSSSVLHKGPSPALSHIQAVPSPESSTGVRSTAHSLWQGDVVDNTSLYPSSWYSFTGISHSEDVFSGTWLPARLSSSTNLNLNSSIWAPRPIASPTDRPRHATQAEQLNGIFSELIEGSDSPSSASHCFQCAALAHINYPVFTAMEAAASCDSFYTAQSVQSPSNHHSSHLHISQTSANASTTHALNIKNTSIPHATAGCTATNQIQEVAELLKHAGNLLSYISISNAQHVHVHPNDCKCTSCSCACTQAPQPPSSVYEVDGGARAASTPIANPAPTEATSSQGETQDHPSSGRPAKDPHNIQQPTSAAQKASSGQQALPGQLAGWAAVEKALKDFDQQEIGGYKEDIDSLLTFTGLYSAVLTAFVIVSYPLLQDPNQASASMSMPTISAPSSPFQPPITAIRINILWFASLVISLATASFAILVKQWLRAYMAFATASPQGQLRVRHFRRSGLTAWRVFGIASTLPLLLQISLALFFVGLCIFTWDVHPTLGKTTLPLVGAWALLFLVVTVAPSFSARCPYTTPALAGITQLIRTHVSAVLIRIIMKSIPCAIACILYKMFDWIDDLSKHPGTTRGYKFFSKVDEQLKAYRPWKPVEEADMIKDMQLDLEILASADALQADDRLLGTTIKSALEQSDANWVQLVEFAVQIIGNRIPVVNSETNLGHILSAYGSLSPSVRGVIEEIFHSHAIFKVTELGDSSVTIPKRNWKTVARWAFQVLTCVNDPEQLLLNLDLEANQSALVRAQAGMNRAWQLKRFTLALKLYHGAEMGSDFGNIDQSALQLILGCLWTLHRGDVYKENQLLRQCLSLQFTAICQVTEAVYTGDVDIHHLANVMHSIVDYSSDFTSLKAIEVLKLSLLCVRVIYGKIHDNRESGPRWSSNEAKLWKRTFIWLADRLSHFLAVLFSQADEHAELQQLARSGWGEIPDPTEDSSQEALPLPDYFYLMLGRTAGRYLSQIPSQHPQLLQIAQMSWDEQADIWNKGYRMAEAYRRSPGNLYPPGVEDDNGDGLEGTGTSALPQGIRDLTISDPQVEADELRISEELQQEQPMDISAALYLGFGPLSETEFRAAEAAEQYSQTDSGPADSIQPGQTPSPIHETSEDSEHTGSIQSESIDGRDDPKELQPEGTPMELPEEVEDLAGTAAHPTSVEDKFASSLSEGCPTPVSLPTSARNETVPAEAQEGSEVTTDHARAYPISDHAASLLGDGAAAEDDLQHADNIAAGNLHTIQGTRDEVYTHADVEAGTGSEEKMAEAGPRPGE